MSSSVHSLWTTEEKVSGLTGLLPSGNGETTKASGTSVTSIAAAHVGATSTPGFEQRPAGGSDHDPTLTPALGALLPTVGPRPVEGAPDPDPLAFDIGPAQGAELTPPGPGEDGQGQEHPPAFVALGSSGQERLHLLDGGNLELGMAQGRGLGPLGRVAVDPAPADGLAECGREHGMVAADAGRLERTVTALTGGQLAVPLVEVPGRQLGDRDVAELGVDDGLGRPPGVVERPGGPAPGLAVAQPFLDEGADGGGRVRGAPVRRPTPSATPAAPPALRSGSWPRRSSCAASDCP